MRHGDRRPWAGVLTSPVWRSRVGLGRTPPRRGRRSDQARQPGPAEGRDRTRGVPRALDGPARGDRPAAPGVRGLRFGVVTPVVARGSFLGRGRRSVVRQHRGREHSVRSGATSQLLVADRRSFLGEAQSGFVEEHTVVTPAGEHPEPTDLYLDVGLNESRGSGHGRPEMLPGIVSNRAAASGPGRPRWFTIERIDKRSSVSQSPEAFPGAGSRPGTCSRRRKEQV